VTRLGARVVTQCSGRPELALAIEVCLRAEITFRGMHGANAAVGNGRGRVGDGRDDAC
jgi:hypothetical protein